LFAPAQRQTPFLEINFITMNLDSKMTVSELLMHYPQTVSVFLRRKMFCVGCPAETFHTVEDVARIYGIALEQFLRELREAINCQGESLSARLRKKTKSMVSRKNTE
jgi:hybrid cluster-associated redox disulfide protein